VVWEIPESGEARNGSEVGPVPCQWKDNRWCAGLLPRTIEVRFFSKKGKASESSVGVRGRMKKTHQKAGAFFSRWGWRPTNLSSYRVIAVSGIAEYYIDKPPLSILRRPQFVLMTESQTQYYHHRRFRVEGGVLPDAVTAFRTYGDPKNPCIVFPTCYSGKLDCKSLLDWSRYVV